MNDLVLLCADNAFYMQDLKVCYFYDLDIAEKYKKAFKLNEYNAVKFKDLAEDNRKQLCNDLARFIVVFIAMMFDDGRAVALNCDGLKELLEAQNIRTITKSK